MKVKFPNFKSFEYVEVFKITEYKDGAVYKTKALGFAHRDRPKQKDEIYAPLSTSITKNADIELELMSN